MIKRIKKVENFHVFKNFSWPSDLTEFKKFNLIYGWNGSGKTTLANLFRQMEDKVVIDDCGKFEFDTASGPINESNLTRCNLQIKVFNQDFIKENVFTKTGEVSPIFFIGKDGISKQKEIDELKIQLSSLEDDQVNNSRELKKAEAKLEKFCTDKAKTVRDFLRSSGDNQYNNYTKAKFKPKCESLLKKDYKKFILSDSEFDGLKEKIGSNPKEKLEKISDVFEKTNQLFSRTQAILSKTVTADTIDRFEKNDRLNRWADQGLKFLKENNTDLCPFCNQKISDDFKTKLEQHFNDAYEKFSIEIDGLIQEIKTAKEKFKIVYPQKKNFYIELSDEYEIKVKALEKELTACSSALDVLLENLEKKKNIPFKPLEFKNEVFDSEIVKTIKSINTIIDKHNQKTTNFLIDMDTSRLAIENHLVAESLDDYLEMEKKIPPLYDNLETLSNNIVEYQNRIEKLVSEVVGHRKPAEEINRDLHSYLGRNEIKFTVRENGYVITRNGVVAEALSEGEKTAISFIYFLKSLKDKDFDIAHGILVIDDPISSLDSNSLYNAFGFMKNRTKEVSQIFVLTHNFSFFNEVKNWWKRDHTVTSYYMLTTTIEQKNRVAQLLPLDNLLKKYNSEYHYLFKLVYNQAKNNTEDFENYYLLPNISRRLLEAFLAFRVPSLTGNLYQQLNKIKFDGEKKIRIYRYINENSHSGHIRNDFHDDLSFLAETREVLKDILTLIETEDKKHFLEMKSIIEPATS